MRSNGGLTLLEVMIASLILAVISSAIYLVLFNATVSYTNQTRLGDIQDRARRVLDEMANEIRQADQASIQITALNGAQAVTFRVPKRFDPANANPDLRVVWSTTADNAAFYTAGSPYPAYAFTVRHFYEPSPVDANHNAIQDEGRIVRVLVDPATGSEIAGTRRVLTDYVKPGSLVIASSDDGTGSGIKVALGLTLMIGDYRNKTIETRLETTVNLRNRS